MSRNRIHNSGNPFQRPDKFKRALCLCSAGLLRSPTLSYILQSKFSRNCRAAGVVPAFALIVVDDVLISWADEVWCVSHSVTQTLWALAEQNKWEDILANTTIITMDIPDQFEYMDDKLVDIMTKSVNSIITSNKLPA
jgi:predicted protein tyrosine phosphatase